MNSQCSSAADCDYIPGMDDDWRLRIDLHEHGRAHGLLERLDSSELEHQLDASFTDRVAVSRENSELFVYAGSRDQAEKAGQVAQSFADEHQWDADFELRRWHPEAERWEDPDAPLPATHAQHAAEHAELIASERQESEPAFEVRVQCSSRTEARELVEKLRREGLPAVRRYSYVLVGVRDEDTAQALTDRLRAEAPAGSEVTAEGTARTVLAAVGTSPFAVFGGLGG